MAGWLTDAMIAELRRFILRLLTTLRPCSRERDLERELLSHVALVEDEHRLRGATPAEARLAARRAVGSIALAEDLHRDARSFVWIDDLRRDVRYAARTFARFPGFTAIVLLTLALGIGADTAIFSVVHSVLLTPLPYPESGRLVRIWENVPGAEIGDGKGPDRRYGAMEVGDLLEASKRAKTVTALANYGLAQVTATFEGEATRLEGFSVSGDLFRLLGVPAQIGRTIAPDDATPGRDHVVVLSDESWKRLGGTTDLIGRRLVFSGDAKGPFTGGIALGEPYTIVGVMPAGFRFPYENARFWVPRVLAPGAGGRPVRRETIARLAPGATPQAAAAELAAIRMAARGASPGQKPGSPPRYELIRLHDEITAPVRPALLVLSAAVAIVLLIACVNVANLLLARGLARRRELAVRAAIGACKGRLVRQLLAESLLLSGAGGVGGIVLACAGVRAFRGLGATLGRSDLGTTVVFPRLAEVRVDATVLGYAVALSLVTGLVFGLLPALRFSRFPGITALRSQQASDRTRLKDLLVAMEIALATVLLVGGGLVINSFIRLATVDPGFDPSHLLTFQVDIRRPAGQLGFAEALVARLRTRPGVVSAAYARQLPLVSLQDSIRLTLRRNGVEQALDDAPDIRFVSRDYLPTLRVPILSGRGLTEDDGPGSPPVVLINDALAMRDFRGVDPIGETILLGPPGHRVAMEIVGVVGNIRQFGFDRPPESQYFMDIRQVPTDPAFRMPPLFPVGAYYTVRVAGDPDALVADVRRVVGEVDPTAAVGRIATMEQIVSNSMTRPRMYAVLVAIFSAVALALSVVGLFGVMSYTVTQRTRELGIRMALGAQRRQVMRLVLKQSGMLIGFGLGAGLAGAGLAVRYLEGLLYGLTPLDPTTFATVAIVFPAVALAASYVPARRATAIDPLDALRCE